MRYDRRLVKIVVFGQEQRVGALEGEHVIDLNRAGARMSSQANADARLPASLEAFIGLGDQALDEARRAIEHARSSEPDGLAVHPAASVKLHAPWARRRVACAGGNFGDHLRGMESGSTTIEEVVSRARDRGQWGFWKVPDAIRGPEEDVPFPSHCTYLDYEGEAAIVIGKRGKDIPADLIDDYVWGITLLNDWSKRDGARADRPMSYNLAKNFDGSTSMGPCIVVGELEAQDVDVETRVNGQTRQSYNTRDMVWSFAEILEFLSVDFTFVPGDVISGGTAKGTAADQTKRLPDGTRPLDLFLKVGDVVEVSSPKIGTLRNRLVRA